MLVEFLNAAYDALIDLCLAAGSRGTETHAYLLGYRSSAEAIVTTVLRAGSPVEEGAMTQPDYAASAVAMQPYLDRGLTLLGEAHRHPGLIGPSAGDRRMLLDIPQDRFPRYLAVVVATFRDERPPVVTAHSIEDGEIVEHKVRVIDAAYPALLPSTVQQESVLSFGNGSGNSLVLLQVAKLPIRRLTIADDDTFEERNLVRHLVDHAALGKNKAVVGARFLRRRSTAKISAVRLHVGSATMAKVDRLVRDHSFVINGTGHPVASARISQSCARQRRTCLHSAAFARGAGGFVFLQAPGGPCYECLYDLNLESQTDDHETMQTLVTQYGYTEEELHAQIGLWADVNTIASVAAKVVLDYFKYGNDSRRPNLYVIDNHYLTINRRRVQRRTDCTTCKEAS